jgi:hypothetical protein
MCEITGGCVERVDPTTLIPTLKNVLSTPIIGCGAVVKIILPKCLKFRNE